MDSIFAQIYTLDESADRTRRQDRPTTHPNLHKALSEPQGPKNVAMGLVETVRIS